MSSTNRGDTRTKEREEKQDYYVTPHWAVREFLKVWNQDSSTLDNIHKNFNSLVLDPCAGGDDVNDMSYPLILDEYGIKPLTIDIRADSKAMIIADYLATDVGAQFDLIITNPPFNLAQSIIDKALADCKNGGYVVMLLRLNFLGGQARAPWLKTKMPTDIYVHTKRMGFNPEFPNKTDSIEYAHFVWTKGETPSYAKTHTIIHQRNDII